MILVRPDEELKKKIVFFSVGHSFVQLDAANFN